jgi:hypothetical protein
MTEWALLVVLLTSSKPEIAGRYASEEVCKAAKLIAYKNGNSNGNTDRLYVCEPLPSLSAVTADDETADPVQSHSYRYFGNQE